MMTFASRGNVLSSLPKLSDPIFKQYIKEYERTFALFDKSREGAISCRELKTVLVSLGHDVSDVDVSDILKSIGRSEDSKIEFGEFLAIMADRFIVTENEDEILEDVFDSLDINNDGLINTWELMQVMRHLQFGQTVDRRDVMEMIAELDVDGDGAVDFQEFRRIIGK